MANTTNLGLTKLDGTEKLKTFPTTFNGDMDTIDTVVGNDVGTSRTISQAITKTEEGIAIVANGNTHSAISSGQYVYVKNHGSLSEGMYQAKAAISANAALSTGNLTPISEGGLNHAVSALNSNIATLRSKLAWTLLLNGIGATERVFSTPLPNNANEVLIAVGLINDMKYMRTIVIPIYELNDSFTMVYVPAYQNPATDRTYMKISTTKAAVGLNMYNGQDQTETTRYHVFAR